MYGPQKGRMGAEKKRFYDDFRSVWDLHSVDELILGIGDLYIGDVGIERSSGSDGKGVWIEILARTTKEDVEDASGDKGCHESSEMESWSWGGCCYSGVNSAIFVYHFSAYLKLF